jgi:chaperone modulatory protein CbpM
MNVERIEATWLEEHRLVSFDELTDRWGVSSSQLHDFIAHGVLEPAAAAHGAGFRVESVSLVRTACRLQQELELDTHAVGVVLELLQRLRALETEVGALRAQLGAARQEGGDAPEAEIVRSDRP